MAKDKLKVGLELYATDRMTKVIERATTIGLYKFEKKLQAIQSIGLGAGRGISKLSGFLIKNTEDIAAKSLKISRMSESVGLSTDSFQKLSYAAGRSGVDINKFNSSMVMLDKFMINTAKGSKDNVKLFKGLGISVTDSSGQIRKNEYVLKDLADIFSKTEDNAAKTAIATKLFGRSGAQMIPMLNKGIKGIDELGSSLVDTGNFISSEMIDKFAIFSKQQKDIENRINTVKLALASAFIPVLTELGKAITPVLNYIGDFIKNNPGWTNAILITAGLIMGLAFIIGALSKVIFVSNAMMDIFIRKKVLAAAASKVATAATATETVATGAATTATWGLNAAWLASPITWIVVGIMALVAGFVLLWNKCAGFRAFLKTMWDTIKQFGNIIKDFVIDRITGLLRGISGLGEAIALLFQGEFSQAWETGKQAVVDIIGIEDIKKAGAGIVEAHVGFGDKFDYHNARENTIQAEKEAEKNAASGQSFMSIENGFTSGVQSNMVPASNVVSSNKPNINYNPQIRIEGNADKDTIKKALKENKEEFNKFISDWFENKRRTGFDPALY